MLESGKTALDVSLRKALSQPESAEELAAEPPKQLTDAVLGWVQSERIERGRTFCPSRTLAAWFRRWVSARGNHLLACVSQRAVADRLGALGFRRARSEHARGWYVSRQTAQRAE